MCRTTEQQVFTAQTFAACPSWLGAVSAAPCGCTGLVFLKYCTAAAAMGHELPDKKEEQNTFV